MSAVSVVQNIQVWCSEPTCTRPAIKKVFVQFDRGYLAKLTCGWHITWARAAMLARHPDGWLPLESAAGDG